MSQDIHDPDFRPDPRTPVAPFDLFPDLKGDIDERVQHSEVRLKNWVLAGVIANLLVAIGGAGPIVFYLGQISRDINTSLATQQAQTVELQARQKWMQDRMVWEARVEAALEAKGFKMPSEPRRYEP